VITKVHAACGAGGAARSGLVQGVRGRASTTSRAPSLSVHVDITDIRGMGEPATQGSAPPAALAAGRFDAKVPQILGQAHERLLILSVAAQPLLANGPCCGLAFHTRRIARSVRMHTLAVRGTRPGEEEPRAEFHWTPPSSPFGHHGAFIGRQRAANLPQ
jgi:hypothetical protein